MAPELSPPAVSIKPKVSIEYCPRCGWLLRAAWLAQELLTTFERELGGLELIPSEASGTFEVRVGADVVWNRRADHGFPQAADLKRRVRDRVAPGRSLGHSDSGGASSDGAPGGTPETS
ncbi:MAG TPA: SelT/SelW/SelH family protein [Polyangiaceae bacterium]|nr:SelT/SelW/SelH family protein [Polyangiaceae bacterium]